MDFFSLKLEQKNILAAQCVDNALSLLLATLTLAAGMSLFQEPTHLLIQRAGAGFWLGFFGLLWGWGFLVRFLSVALLGRSPGCLFTGLQVRSTRHLALNCATFLAESAQVAFPALWMLDVLLRKLDFRCGLNYVNSYERLELV